MKEELLKGLSEEQIAKIKECKNHEELLNLAKTEGIELTDEQLQAISGGCGGSAPHVCPFCGSKNVLYKLDTDNVVNWFYECSCADCKAAWRDDD